VRILLIWPHNPATVLNESLSCCEPLPLEYLAGALKTDHDVTIFDARLDPPLASLGTGEAPGLIGLAIPYTSVLPSARRIAAQAKLLWPGVPIVIGGHHPSITRDWLDDAFPADYIVAGEGGAAIVALANGIAARRPFEPVPGLARYGDRFTALTRPIGDSLDDQPMPDRNAVRHNRDRFFHSIYHPVALVRFSAGCPYECTFCSLWRMTERKYLTKRNERIVEELASIDATNVYVVDDEAFIQPARMDRLADDIAASGLRKRFHMYVRTDTALRNPALMEKWVGIGLDSVLVGAESPSDRELNTYKKGTSAAGTARAVHMFHGYGVKVRANFIVPPEYREDDFARLAAHVRALRIDLPSFSVLTPLPGTKLYEETRAQFVSDNPELLDCYHSALPTALSPERFYSSFVRLLRDTADRDVGSRSTKPMFYFSSADAFEKMTAEIARGHELSALSWSEMLHQTA